MRTLGYLVAIFLGIGLLAALPIGGVAFLGLLLVVGLGGDR